MKLGLLTFHRALNYGAVLQTYASVQFLRQLGHEVFVLDYRCAALEETYRPFRRDPARWRSEGWRYALKWLPVSFLRAGRARGFARFRQQNLPLLPFAQAEELEAILVGSDQVWNESITGADPVYAGAFLPGVKKVAWAASAGSYVPPEERIKAFSETFSSISVREASLRDLLPGSVLLADPCALLSETEWRRLVHPVGGPYVLAFPMNNDARVLQSARQIARERHLPLKILSQRASLQFDRIQGAGPEDFLSLMAAAEYVVTSSYHGALFSKIFSREHTWICEPSDPRFRTLEEMDFNRAQAHAANFLKKALR